MFFLDKTKAIRTIPTIIPTGVAVVPATRTLITAKSKPKKNSTISFVTKSTVEL